MKLQSLKPRVQALSLTRVNVITTRTDRMTGRPLQRRNRRFLREHPLCVECERQDRVAAAQQVDHVVPLHLGGADDESNLQGLCCECHERKTKNEARHRALGTAAVTMEARKSGSTWGVER